MPFCVSACSVCKHLCYRRWGELRRVGQSWEGEKIWDELRKRWDELSGGEKRWEELRRWQEVRRVEASWEEWRQGGQRWESLRRVEKSREEVKRVELRRGGVEQFWACWKELQKLRRSEKGWEVVTIEKGWRKTANSENRVAKLRGFTAAPIGKTCFWDPIAARFL